MWVSDSGAASFEVGADLELMMGREKDVNAAALGTEDAADLLRRVGIEGLRRKAGYVAGDCGLVDTGLTLENAQQLNLSPSLNPFKNHEDGIFVNHDELSEAHEVRIKGVIQLPSMKLAEGLSNMMNRLLQWTRGRAWIAGGVVVHHLFSSVDAIDFNDIDIFCWTDEIYEAMVAELRKVRS